MSNSSDKSNGSDGLAVARKDPEPARGHLLAEVPPVGPVPPAGPNEHEANSPAPKKPRNRAAAPPSSSRKRTKTEAAAAVKKTLPETIRELVDEAKEASPLLTLALKSIWSGQPSDTLQVDPDESRADLCSFAEAVRAATVTMSSPRLDTTSRHVSMTSRYISTLALVDYVISLNNSADGLRDPLE